MRCLNLIWLRLLSIPYFTLFVLNMDIYVYISITRKSRVFIGYRYCSHKHLHSVRTQENMEHTNIALGHILHSVRGENSECTFR